ncbi:MAG: hypothetical protein MZV70_42795 [Desulfobacterales bacterium]|nr:hypothetical protein [Desulfobacterales bacterium]
MTGTPWAEAGYDAGVTGHAGTTIAAMDHASSAFASGGFGFAFGLTLLAGLGDRPGQRAGVLRDTRPTSACSPSRSPSPPA